jgi:hypothetical protein
VFAFGTSFSPVDLNVFAKPGDGAAVELSVDKFNVTPDYSIVYKWTLLKTASPTLLELAAGGSGSVTYTVSAVRTQTSTFSLTYNVTVLNKGPGAIQTDIITSIQNPSGSFTHVTETVEDDLAVANGATFTKEYTTSFAIEGNVADITPLKVVVELANTINVGTIKISGTQAAINLKGTPTSVFNETLTVIDSWAGAGPWTFTDTGSVQYTRSFNAGAIEEVSVQAAAASGTVTLDCKTNSVFYYTSNATGNWTLNFRGDGATTMNTFLAVGKSATVVFLATQGVTAFYPTAFQVDGVAVTPRWLGGSAPTGGNASGIDSYTFTIIKIGASTYTVLASQARFA